MKNLTIQILFASFVAMVLISPLQAKIVTKEEALTVAKNWVALIIKKKGAWGDAKTAYVESVQEFKRGNRTLGYFCRVMPKGFVIVSLHKELAPVKANSAESDLDPDSERCVPDLIKDCMESILDRIEKAVEDSKDPWEKVMSEIIEIDYRSSWDELMVDTMSFQGMLDDVTIEMDYQEGEVLLNTSWHQGDPYNRDCPTGDFGCPDCSLTNPGNQTPSSPTVVGCVALAGAQIMKYWNWPPYGRNSWLYYWDGDDSCPAGGTPGTGAQNLSATFSDDYEWPLMANRYVWDSNESRWEDENEEPLSPALDYLEAVSELCYEVGVAVEMDYGACMSSAPTSDMEGVYENFYRYSTACLVSDRTPNMIPANVWFEMMKSDLNANRPIHYRVVNHSIVADGWRETGAGPLREYHMNYGWDSSATTWYTLDALRLGDPNTEYMVRNIYPEPALGSSLAGPYPLLSFPYRYFDRDATGDSAYFQEGQKLQFLPEITVKCTSTAGGYIRFVGTGNNNTRLFSILDRDVTGIRIYNGGIRLYGEGSMRFY